MALNQHKQYFFAYYQNDSDLKSLSYKNDIKAAKKLPYIKNKLLDDTLTVERRNQNTSSFSRISDVDETYATTIENAKHPEQYIEKNLISDSKMYALKKRLLLPSWLLEGVLLVLGTKEPWFDSIASSRVGRIVACPNEINVKTLIPFFSVWHELIARVFNPSSKDNIIRLQLNKYISGTNKDILEISKEIENIFSSPLKLFEIKPSKKSKTYSISKTGSLNFIRQAQLENDVDGIWLTLNLTNSFKEVCYPSELNSFMNGTNNTVSISPTVIQSMGKKPSLKKILNYLFLEFSKQASYSNNSNWNSFKIDCKKIIHFHKDFLSTAPAFYDHGVLGWNNCAPNRKISEIKSMNNFPEYRHEIICSWQLSEQVKEAFEIENAISEKIIQQFEISLNSFEKDYKKPLIVNPNSNSKGAPSSVSLFPEPPEDELKKVREERKIKRILQEKENAVKIKNVEKKTEVKKEPVSKKMGKTIITHTLFDDGIVTSTSPSVSLKTSARSEPRSTFTPSTFNDLKDNEFLILVSEFYESLKPLQKKAFERDRKGMSGEQFKAYMVSILQRKKSAHL